MSKLLKIFYQTAPWFLFVIFTSSCSVTLPRFSRSNTNVTVTNASSQIESLKREDYQVLRSTTGKASTTRSYILFIPIGKHKTNSELFDNAYYNAVENLPNADALLLPRQKNKKLTIPLILYNYNRRTTTVSGVGISIKDKILENTDDDIPYVALSNYYLNPTAHIKQIKKLKITSDNEFKKYFTKANAINGNMTPDIDFSKQYAIVVVGKESKKSTTFRINHLKVNGSKIQLSFDASEGEKQKETQQPFLILAVEKKYQGDIVVN